MLLMVEFEDINGNMSFVNVALLVAVIQDDDGDTNIVLNTLDGDFTIAVKGTPKEVMEKIKSGAERATRGQQLMQGVPR